MTLSDSDRLLVKDGSETNTITFAQFKDGSVLNPTDLFLVNDGIKTETISWEKIEEELGPKGEVVTPTVLKPKDGAGSGDERYALTDKITKVEGGGVITCETDEIESVTQNQATVTLTAVSSLPLDSAQMTPKGSGVTLPGDANNNVTVLNDGLCQLSYNRDINKDPIQDVSSQFGGNAAYSFLAQVRANTTFTFSYTSGPGYVSVNTGAGSTGTIELQGDVISKTVEINSSIYQTSVFSLTGESGTFTLTLNTENYIDLFSCGSSGSVEILTFPSDQGFDCFPDGTVVQEPDVKVISKDDSDPYTITVDGGEWLGSDGSGTADGDTKLVKETPYDAKLTVAGPTDLADMTGTVFMSDGAGSPGPYSQTPYLLTSDEIVSVAVDGQSSTQVGFSGAGEAWDNNYLTWAVIPENNGAGLSGTTPSRNSASELTPFTAYAPDAPWGVGPSGSAGWVIRMPEKRTILWEAYQSPPGTWILPTKIVLCDSDTQPISEGRTINYGGGSTSTKVEDVLAGQVIWMFFDYNTSVSGIGSWKDSPATVLTLASDQDLEYFRVGDVVQSNADATNIVAGDTVDIRISGSGDDQIDIAWAAATVAETLTLFNVQNNGNSATFPGDQTITSVLYKFNKPAFGLEFMGEDEISDNTANWVLSGSSDGVNWTEVIRDNNINGPESTRPGKIKMGSTPYLYWKVSLVSPDGSAKNMGYWFYGWKVYDVIEEVKVISINETVPSIAVDGGEWDASNQSQVWSNYLTSDSTQPDSQGPGGFFPGTPRANAFDGDVANTYTACTGNPAGDPNRTATITFDATGLGLTITKKVGVVMSAGQDVEVITSDGTFTETGLGPLKPLPSEIACTGTLQTIKITTQDPNVWGIYVDGKLLVDAVNDSQVWSNGIDEADLVPGSKASYAFDGITPTNMQNQSNATGFSTTIGTYPLTFASPISGQLEIWASTGNSGTGGTASIKAGGTTLTVDNPFDAPKWYDFGNVSNLNQIDITTVSGSNVLIASVKLDGKLFIDKGIRGLGDSEVTYQTQGGQGTIVEVNTDDNTLKIADTGTSDNRWIADNGAGIEFKVAGPSIIDEPLLTTHVELESTQFATVPDGVDGLKEIVWNINGVDQSAGTNNPYRPTGLPLNSEVTIKVKHIANSIGESQWSTSTKFSTGASRTLKEHYVSRILQLETALEEAKPKRSRKKKED